MNVLNIMINIKFIDQICDGGFSVPGYTPQYFNYVQNETDADYLIYSHFEVLKALPENKDKNLGMVWESPSIMPQIYNLLPSVEHNFKYIFTFNKELIDRNPTLYKFIPAHGRWVGIDHGGHPSEIIRKNRRASVICSEKRWCQGHAIRHSIGQICYNLGFIDCYGKFFNNYIEKVVDAIEPYFFNVVVENSFEPNYFTEKILNCFACGTVPIYLGCPNIGDFFNIGGIILLDIDNFESQIKNITELDYANRIDAIQDNYHRVQEYGCLEDWVAKKLF